MDLTSVHGVGPKKAEALMRHGIQTAEDLAAIDLRGIDGTFEGWTRDGLKSAKAAARKQLARQSIPYQRARYKAGSKPRNRWWRQRRDKGKKSSD